MHIVMMFKFWLVQNKFDSHIVLRMNLKNAFTFNKSSNQFNWEIKWLGSLKD